MEKKTYFPRVYLYEVIHFWINRHLVIMNWKQAFILFTQLEVLFSHKNGHVQLVI